MPAGPEVTPRCRVAIVSLGHSQIGINPLSLCNLAAVLGVAKTTYSETYKHAIKNTAARWLVEMEATSASVSAQVAIESASGRSSEDADVFFKGIDAELDSLYTVPEKDEDLKRGAHRMLQLTSCMKIY